MKKIVYLLLMILIGVVSFSEVTIEPTVLKKEIRKGVSSFELFKIKNMTTKKIKYTTSYDLYYVDKNGNKMKIMPKKTKKGGLKILPNIGLSIGTGGIGGGIGIDVSPSAGNPDEQSGISMQKKIEIAANKEKTLSVGINLKNMVFADDADLVIDNGRVEGFIYINDKSNANNSIEIPIKIDIVK